MSVPTQCSIRSGLYAQLIKTNYRKNNKARLKLNIAQNFNIILIDYMSSNRIDLESILI